MTIYLYKKTHNKTGLKYLGKTSKDPFKYKGSGKDWIPHIKEHGYDVTTIILKECQSNEELSSWGRYYSTLWNVSESVEWANKIPETGGSASGRKRPDTAITTTAMKNKGKKRSEEFKSNRIGELNSFYGQKHSPESLIKMRNNHADVAGSNNPMYGKLGINNPNYGKTWKWSKSPSKKTCPYCFREIGGEANYQRFHGSNCKAKSLLNDGY